MSIYAYSEHTPKIDPNEKMNHACKSFSIQSSSATRVSGDNYAVRMSHAQLTPLTAYVDDEDIDILDYTAIKNSEGKLEIISKDENGEYIAPFIIDYEIMVEGSRFAQPFDEKLAQDIIEFRRQACEARANNDFTFKASKFLSDNGYNYLLPSQIGRYSTFLRIGEVEVGDEFDFQDLCTVKAEVYALNKKFVVNLFGYEDVNGQIAVCRDEDIVILEDDNLGYILDKYYGEEKAGRAWEVIKSKVDKVLSCIEPERLNFAEAYAIEEIQDFDKHFIANYLSEGSESEKEIIVEAISRLKTFDSLNSLTVSEPNYNDWAVAENIDKASVREAIYKEAGLDTKPKKSKKHSSSLGFN